MVDGAVAVHQHHRGGEVEDAGGEDQHLDAAVVRLTHGEGGGGEIEPVQAEHDDGVEAHGGEPGGEDVEDGERPAEDGVVELVVDLVQVSVQGNQDQTERVLLPQRPPHDGLQLAEGPSEGPALREGGIHSPAGHTQPRQQLAQREGDQQQQGGHRQHPDSEVSQAVT